MNEGRNYQYRYLQINDDKRAKYVVWFFIFVLFSAIFYATKLWQKIPDDIYKTQTEEDRKLKILEDLQAKVGTSTKNEIEKKDILKDLGKSVDKKQSLSEEERIKILESMSKK